MGRLTKKIGERIADLRKEKGLTLQKASELAKLDLSYWSAVEKGRYKDIGIENIKKFCKGLNIKIKDLFDGY